MDHLKIVSWQYGCSYGKNRSLPHSVHNNQILHIPTQI